MIEGVPKHMNGTIQTLREATADSAIPLHNLLAEFEGVFVALGLQKAAAWARAELRGYADDRPVPTTASCRAYCT